MKKLAAHIHPEHFERDDDGRELLSHENVFAALRAGKRVFRPVKRPAPKRRLRY